MYVHVEGHRATKLYSGALPVMELNRRLIIGDGSGLVDPFMKESSAVVIS